MKSLDVLLGKAVTALNSRQFLRAEKLFHDVLEIQPEHIGALNLLVVTLMNMERFAEAEELVAKAVRLEKPSDVSFYNYGIILKRLNKPRLALEQFDNALRLNAEVAQTWNNRGTVLNDLHQFEGAVLDFSKAIALVPRYAEAYCNKGKSLSKLNRYGEAVAAYQEALALRPEFWEAWLGLANVLFELKNLEEAFAAYDKTLAINPNAGEAWLGRGNVFAELRNYGKALAAYDKALLNRPDLENAWRGRGNIFFELGRYEEAFVAYERASALNPDFGAAWLGRGNALFELKNYDEAFAAYDKALAIEPGLERAEGQRLHVKQHFCNWQNFGAESAHLISSVRSGLTNAEPFVMLSIPSSSLDQLECAKLWVSKKHPLNQRPVWKGDVYRHDRARIAYISSDFNQHAIAILTAGMFECHDRARFEITAISLGRDDGSESRARLKRAFDYFVDVESSSDQEVVSYIRNREIDLLINLNGFTKHARTNVFARRPAPVQISYLGYPGTMGAVYIDYLIADGTIIPEGCRNRYSEKIVCLPHTYQVNDRGRTISDKELNRSDEGLPSEGFVFCCFNNNYKITPYVFECWMSILKQVDRGILWLLEDNSFASENLKKEAAARGIDPSRLMFAKRKPQADHLARHRLADLFLDTLPYNAHTTASDALWVGLPVLTQIGGTFAGRVAASLLNAIDLPELITHSCEEYEALAVELALNREKYRAIKEKLAKNRLTKPLFDTPLFTRHLEAAYEAMYQRYRAGLPPDHIEIKQ